MIGVIMRNNIAVTVVLSVLVVSGASLILSAPWLVLVLAGFWLGIAVGWKVTRKNAVTIFGLLTVMLLSCALLGADALVAAMVTFGLSAGVAAGLHQYDVPPQ